MMEAGISNKILCLILKQGDGGSGIKTVLAAKTLIKNIIDVVSLLAAAVRNKVKSMNGTGTGHGIFANPQHGLLP